MPQHHTPHKSAQRSLNNHLGKFSFITADELYERVGTILSANDTPNAQTNKMMHDTLRLACNAGLKDTEQSFGNLFSQVDYLCKHHRVNKANTRAIQNMRRAGNKNVELSAKDVAYHCRALCLFISAVFDVGIPSHLTARLPKTNKPQEKSLHVDYRYLRCILKQWDCQRMQVEVDGQADQKWLEVDYSVPQHLYLYNILRAGMQLNLLDCAMQDGVILPSLIVIEPDFLVDISAIARCFTEYGHHPLSYTLNRFSPQANSQAILLGNFAGMALDDVIHQPNDYDWRKTLTKSFKKNALEYTTCPDLNAKEDFKVAAIKQAEHIQQIVSQLFDPQKSDFDRSKAILEPSFVCEQLGLQGRVDLMTTDFKLLIEQKSGSNYNIQANTPNEYGSFQKEEHYVQLLLYYGVLKHNFQLNNKQIETLLLYSKYPLPGGLVMVSYYQKLFHKAIRLRNELVGIEFDIATQGFEHIIDQLKPDVINQKQLSNRFYQQWILPQITAITNPLHQLSPLENAYFCRMMTFVYREQLATKVGSREGKGNSNADLWNMSVNEKIENGNIFTQLSIEKIEASTDFSSLDTITLSVPDQGEDFLPNFRRGDMIYLYAYTKEQTPDVRKSILHKGSLIHITSQQVVVHLHDGLQSSKILDKNALYAIEHGGSDVSTSASIKGLHRFITASPQRKALLLGQRAPQVDSTLQLTRSYHHSYDDILLQIKQARDYFMLVGPPGTGKTSMALQFIVKEELASIQASATHATNIDLSHSATTIPPASLASSAILLMSYTNRAVDEICEMLCQSHIPFIRIGNEYTCDERFKPYLIEQVISDTPRLEAIRGKIEQTQVFVGTTSTLLSRPYLFSLKHFSLAVIDEASQILEPNIIGLLSANIPCKSHPHAQASIDRFVLIGDHKQLPAVVQQNERESTINDPLLTDIELTNCRNSLFERLIRWEQKQGRKSCIGVLRRQGRMHPEVASFPNRMFYAEEQLDIVPCPHQEETSIHYTLPATDELDQLLKKHRVLFFPSPYCHQSHLSDKVNTAEATLVATLLQRIHRFYEDQFDADKTVGVIVPYRNQIAMIHREIERLNIPELNNITIDTVERYQGSQREVIIYSFTIQHRYQLDFLTANSFEENGRVIDRKLNVALTRARRQMILTGHVETLQHNQLFATMIHELQKGEF